MKKLLMSIVILGVMISGCSTKSSPFATEYREEVSIVTNGANSDVVARTSTRMVTVDKPAMDELVNERLHVALDNERQSIAELKVATNHQACSRIFYIPFNCYTVVVGDLVTVAMPKVYGYYRVKGFTGRHKNVVILKAVKRFGGVVQVHVDYVRVR